MKKLFSWMLIFGILLSLTGCATNMPETLLTVAEDPFAPTTGKFLTPPKGYVVIAEGNIPLKTGGYTWSGETGRGTGETIHADQAIRPLSVENMETVTFQAVPIDGITMSEDGYVAYMGCRVSLDWQIPPDAVSGVCWPTDYKTDEQPELRVSCKTDHFTAYVGSFIYELSATWADHGEGYSGKATYYIHVIIEDAVIEPIETA